MPKPSGLTPLVVGRDQVAILLSVSRATLDRLAAAGKIGPPFIQLSNGRIGWRFESIREWIDAAERLGHLPDRNEWQAMQQMQTI